MSPRPAFSVSQAPRRSGAAPAPAKRCKRRLQQALVALAALAFGGAACAPPRNPPLMVADTNRDGLVRFDDDQAARDRWTAERGAILMFNNDSDRNTDRPDHEDEVVNGRADLDDLALIRIRRVPNLGEDSRLFVSISPAARAHVHLFCKVGGEFAWVRDIRKHELPASLLKGEDLELRIEATSYPTPAWDGTVTVTASLETAGRVSRDSVRLRVAPFIMLPASQRALRLYVREFPGRNEAFIAGLKEITRRAGVELQVVPAGTYEEWNIWLQDVMEVGYSQVPRRRFHVALKANRGKSLDEMPRQKILGPNHGWFRVGSFVAATGAGRGGDSWLDWYGNLEVTPPLPGKPFGRIFYGCNRSSGRSLNPQILEFLEAQRLQSPLIRIQTGWLLIKHVDEIFNFVPARKGRGFKVLVPDVRATYRLLEQWARDGNGALPVLRGIRKNETVSSILGDRGLREYNRRLQETEIEASIGTMKQAIGIGEADIVRVPALYEGVEGNAAALLPNLVNSVFLNGYQLMADPRGPVYRGKDLMQEHVKGLLAKEKIDVFFLDDLPYHLWGGSVHCATNVTREPFPFPWWR